ncbi:hypothetical protein B0T24DRAFT_596321 [Lasiosphaeria ovina]|uniref:Uncharacterized protein n=1 Tax=Lasiosphaeria ovina TaxID=92902 RepID=A0AAE0N495_9PEZI|nr:hypothetical protein B0T24DRAFT_596321 [Lasiosphaeria ovina]
MSGPRPSGNAAAAKKNFPIFDGARAKTRSLPPSVPPKLSQMSLSDDDEPDNFEFHMVKMETMECGGGLVFPCFGCLHGITINDVSCEKSELAGACKRCARLRMAYKYLTTPVSTRIKPTLDSFVQVLPQPKSQLPILDSRDTPGFRDAPPPPPPPPTKTRPLTFRATTDPADKMANSTGSASPAAQTSEVAELTRKVVLLSRQVAKQDRQIGRLTKVLKYNGVNISEDEEDEVDGGGYAGKGNKRKKAVVKC